MAIRTVVTDDLTRKDAEVSHKYRLTIEPEGEHDAADEATGVLDLSPESASALWNLVTELDSRDLATVLRKSPVRLAGSSNGTSALSEVEVIRAWAKAQPNLSVKDRGALSETVMDAYRKAHSDQ